MARKIQKGNIKPKDFKKELSTTTYKGGRITTTKSRVKTNKKTGEVYRVSSTSSVNVLSLVFLILMITMVFGFLTSKEPKTFYGLLQMLEATPAIPLDFLNWTALSLGDWGVFNVFRDLLMFGIDIINVCAFLCTGLAQLLLYILYVFGWIIA